MRSIRQAGFKLLHLQEISCIGYNAVCLFVFYVPSTARSFRNSTPPPLPSLAKDVKLGKYTIPTGNRKPGPLCGSPLCYCCATQAFFRRMPKINSVRGLSSIKAIPKCEVNLTSRFQNIVFTSNCGQADGQGHSIIHPVFRQAYKKDKVVNNSV